MKYRVHSQMDFNGFTEFDTLMSARRYCIQNIAKKKMGKYGKDYYYHIYFGKTSEMIQARNDSRSNYICVIRGPGGNKSYLQILNPKGEPVSPKMSVYAFEGEWKNGLKWYYNYKQ